MYGYVYKTTNIINNKIYIGQHKHKEFDKYYKGSGVYLQEAFNKYGKENFICELVEWCDTAELLTERETYWIKYFNALNHDIGYNLAEKGSGCSKKQQLIASNYMKNRVVTEETKEKMSNSAKHRTLNRITNGNKIWITDGVTECLIDNLNQLCDYPGYYKGRCKNNYTLNRAKEKYANGCYIHLDNKTLYIDKILLQEYLDKGYSLGKSRNNYSDERNANLSKSKSGTIAITDGNKNFYIKPELLPEYELKGFVKGTYQKLNKLRNNI